MPYLFRCNDDATLISIYDLSWDTHLGHQARSDVLKIEKPLKNQRLIGILVEAEGVSNLHHLFRNSLILLTDAPARLKKCTRLGVRCWVDCSIPVMLSRRGGSEGSSYLIIVAQQCVAAISGRRIILASNGPSDPTLKEVTPCSLNHDECMHQNHLHQSLSWPARKSSCNG
jgi:hypothetical protein